MSIDPSEHSVGDLREELQATDDLGAVEAALDAERAGKARKTAIEALEKRASALRDEAGADDEAGGGADITSTIEDAAAAGETAEEAEDADEEPEPEPEPEEEDDGGPSPSYPDADADERVIYDPAGAGAIYGHETIHLTDDGRNPRCEANVGANASPEQRSALPEDIDECHQCLSA